MKKILLFLAAILISSVSVSAQKYFIESDGVGPIKTGMTIKDLPKSVVGLYDNVNIFTEYDDFEGVTITTALFLTGSEELFYAKASEEGIIYDVRTISSKLTTKSGAYADMSAQKFITLPGVKVSVNPEADEYYQISFEIDGIQVGIDGFSASGEKKRKTAVRTGKTPQFTPTDFTPQAIIVLGGFMM